MARTFLSLAAFGALVFSLAGARPARAAPPEGAPPPGAPAANEASAPADDPAQIERNKEEARAHFLKGAALMDQRAWEPALEESRTSRQLYPTKNATYNVALCLKNLQRFDEAIEMFEALLRDFPKLPLNEKEDAQRQIDELRAVVGTVEVTGAKPGASIVIDGRDRGDYPPVNPIRVAAGTHTVRVFKEGYSAFETSVGVVGGRTVSVPVTLVMLTDAGRLKVTEQTGKVIDVLVDSVVVGKTPWEGALSVGDHMVVLRGEGSLGTAPASAPVKARQLSTLSLRAEELEATLRVDPTPAGASVTIDAVPVGRGTWQGALRSGAHRVEVRFEGYVPVKRQVTLARGQQEQIAIGLERDADAEMWKKPSKITFDADVGLAVVPSLGGDVAGGCVDRCSRAIGLGGLGLFHAGYELGSGLGFGATAGYLIAVQEAKGRSSTINPVGLSPNQGTVNDQLRLSAFVVGATVGYRMGENIPFLARLGAGVVLGSVRDQREGSFTTAEGARFSAFPVTNSPAATYAYLDPEVQIGVRISERFELGVGVQALVLLALSQPRFNDQFEFKMRAPAQGNGTYPDDTLTGPIVFLLVPGLSARYAF